MSTQHSHEPNETETSDMTKHPSQADLVAFIQDGIATNGQLREYARRTEQRSKANTCEANHPDCALVESGPCLLRVLDEIGGAV